MININRLREIIGTSLQDERDKTGIEITAIDIMWVKFSSCAPAVVERVIYYTDKPAPRSKKKVEKAPQ